MLTPPVGWKPQSSANPIGVTAREILSTGQRHCPAFRILVLHVVFANLLTWSVSYTFDRRKSPIICNRKATENAFYLTSVFYY